MPSTLKSKTYSGLTEASDRTRGEWGVTPPAIPTDSQTDFSPSRQDYNIYRPDSAHALSLWIFMNYETGDQEKDKKRTNAGATLAMPPYVPMPFLYAQVSNIPLPNIPRAPSRLNVSLPWKRSGDLLLQQKFTMTRIPKARSSLSTPRRCTPV